MRPGKYTSGAAFLLSATLLLLAGLVSVAAGPEIPSVKKYGERPEIYVTDEEEAGMEALSESLTGYGGDPLEIDPRLVLAARAFAREMRKRPDLGEAFLKSNDAVELLNRHGIYEGSTRMRKVPYSEAADLVASLKAYYRPRQLDYTHIGLGAFPPGRGLPGLAVLIIVDRRVELTPFPINVNHPSSYTLRGKLVNRVRGYECEVLLTPPTGSVRKIDTGSSGDSFSASIPFGDGPGTYRIEVVARGNGDVEMAALLKVNAGYGTGNDFSTFTIEGYGREPADEAEAERMVFEMINEVRANEGLNHLSWNEDLAELGKSHARDMMRNGYVGHKSPVHGTLNDRVLAAGLDGFPIKENVATNSSLVQAMNSLLQSPAHRSAIMDPRLNSVGVGVAIRESGKGRNYFVAQEFGKL